MIPVLEFKVELLSNHRWRVTDEWGASSLVERVTDIGIAVSRLIELRAQALVAREERGAIAHEA